MIPLTVRHRVSAFMAELQRRHVYRVLVGYAIGAWLAIQIAESTFSYVGLPDAAVTFVIVMAVAGAPIALVLAWVFDITPGGIQATGPADTIAIADAPAPPAHQPQPLPAPDPLPTPVTALIGREAELADAETLLRDEARLLTVTGPGGAGKTRFALELAHRLGPTLSDGAAWIALADVSDAALVPSAIGTAFHIGETGGEDVLERVAAALRQAELLLVLDNLEQLLSAAPVVAGLLRACPRVRILATSRSPLRLRGERDLPLPPLDVPDPAGIAADLMRSAAVRLFVERARDTNPAFEPTESNVSEIAAICQRLDGLPLALELAAARSKVLTPAGMLARLEQRLPLLSRSARDMPFHQRTMRETIDWSHELMREPERALFRRLAVFAGGAQLQAIEAVTRDGLEGDPLDLLQELVDQSLVQPVSADGPDPRFRMLGLIREYAEEQLMASGEEVEMRTAHATYFAALVESAEPQLIGPRQAEWLDVLDREHDNLRFTLNWLERADPVAGLAMATALRRFFEGRGYLSEGRRRLETLLQVPAMAENTKLRGRALYALGVLADAQADYAAARVHFAEYLTLNRELGDAWGVANALNNMGVILLRHGDYEAAHQLYTESVSLWRDLGNDAAVALALDNLGNAARMRGDYHAARAALDESLRMHRAAEDANGCALTLGLLGEVARAEGALADGERLYDESLALFRSVGNAPQVARSLLELGSIREARGLHGPAMACYAAALRAYADVGSPAELAETFEHLASRATEERDAHEADIFAGAARALRERGAAFDASEAYRLALDWADRLSGA